MGNLADIASARSIVVRLVPTSAYFVRSPHWANTICEERTSYRTLAGASLLQIGAVLGHRDPKSTSIYARLNQQAQREAQAAGDKKMRAMMLEAQKAEKNLPTLFSAGH